MTDINRTTDDICVINQNRVQKLLPNLIESKASFQLKEKKKKVCLLFLHNKCSPNILFG